MEEWIGKGVATYASSPLKNTKKILKIQEQMDSQERHHHQVSVSLVGLVLMEFIRAHTQETRNYL